jgi:site-specific DNA recombinase
MKAAAIYARVSSDKQKDENTIASQTAALRAFARERGFSVPDEWVIEDNGYSGSSLIRPGLERLRDLAAEGQIEVVLVYSPDRLSRKYAYQVLLIEEFTRHHVETVFVRAPRSDTPEDHLLLQFQGMIAEYERAQILERSRRGKRHRAQQGVVNVLCGAPYGYQYVRKSDGAPASYRIIEDEAAVVRLVYECYTIQHMSIGAITRLLNERGVPTRKRISCWERSTVWAILRNPAYKGKACFGKTKLAMRQRITRRVRMRGHTVARQSACRDQPREQWIEIPVPAIVSEETFALAEELLRANKRHAPRRTITPSIVQGLISCQKCGYALYRTSTRSSTRKIIYYRCLGSDAYRYVGGRVCDSRPVRQELVDGVVWREVVRLLENPKLIQFELERRLTAAREANPHKRREEALRRDLIRMQKGKDRLMTAYQEDLISLDELRQRMPDLRNREQLYLTELQSLHDQLTNRAAYLHLAETLSGFLARLRTMAQTMDVTERQRIVRLLVKEVLVNDDTIVIRHSVPMPNDPPDDTGSSSPSAGAERTPASGSYLLRTGSNNTALRSTAGAAFPAAHASLAIFIPLFDGCLQPHLDEAQDIPIDDASCNRLHQRTMRDRIEVFGQISVYHIRVAATDKRVDFFDRVESATFRAIAIGAGVQIRLEDRLKHQLGCGLYRSVPYSWYPERSFAVASRLRDHYPSHRCWSIRLLDQLFPDAR